VFSNYASLAAAFAVAALLSVLLSSTMGARAAAGMWVAFVAVACGGTAILLDEQAPGSATALNRLAAVVLPWGYGLGDGRLTYVAIESWLRWSLFGIAIVVASSRAAYVGSVVLTALLAFSWIVDGALIFHLLTLFITRANANPAGTITAAVAVVLLLATSVGLTATAGSAGPAKLALAASGAPVVLVGGAYLVALLLMLAGGGNARWN
jgi:hypothetical protein